MPVYYNEIDPAAAAWLRELVKQGHIAPGDVDERSIEDVYPDDLRGYTQCHFFAGVGVWSHALRQASWPDDRPVWTGSCPCQPFSAAGKGAGFADERHLWPAFHHLISQCRPATVFGEQVASKDGLAWLDLVQADLEGAGYACGALDTCAAGFGAPHIRQRLYWVAHATEQQYKRRGRIWQAGWAEPANGSQPHGLGHAIGAGLEGHAGHGHAEGGRAQQAGSVAPAGSVGGMDNAGSQRRHGQHALLRAEEARWHATGVPEAAGAGQSGRVEHTSGIGWQRGQTAAPGNEHDGPAPEWAQGEYGPGIANTHRLHQHAPGPTNGHWRAADWLLCRDARWRPVEPGLSPVVDGAAARVVRLRGYGNAIVAPQAQAFVEAVMGG